MNEEDILNPTPISDDLVPKKLTPYELLMRQSRKMGSLATRGYDVTKEFLKQDVSNLHPDKLLFGQALQIKGRTRGQAKPSSVDETNYDYVDPKEDLHTIVQKSHEILAGATSVIVPMNLFPDSVVVDRTKITITKRSFFWSSIVISVRIEDVLNVTCSTGPLFGSLAISSRVMNSTDHYEVGYLWRNDAIYLKEIIQGYVIAHHNHIETSHLGREELVQTLIEIGRDSKY